MVPHHWERRHCLRKISQGGAVARVCEFREPYLGGPVWHNQQDLLLILPDIEQCLGEKSDLEKAYCGPVHLCHQTGSKTTGNG